MLGESKKKPLNVSAPAKEGHFRIERKAYQQILESCYGGNMSYLRVAHPDHDSSANVVFFGANYNDYFPVKNLYKAMSIIKPDAIVVQLKPDILLKNFQNTQDINEHDYLK